MNADQILDYIRNNVDGLVIRNESGSNPGVCQYDLVGKIGNVSIEHIQKCLNQLVDNGDLKIVDERCRGLAFYLLS